MQKYGLGQSTATIATTPSASDTITPAEIDTAVAQINTAATSAAKATTAESIAASINVPIALYNLAMGLAVAYHGYKRNNDSIVWGLGWMFLPNLIEIPLQFLLTLPIPMTMAISTAPLGIAFAQGFAKPLHVVRRRRLK